MKIIKWPNEILTTPTEYLPPKEIKSPEIQALIEDMIDVCWHTGGLGLAANQVGIGKALLVYRKPGTDRFGVLANPVITWSNGEMISKDEGCLSIPNKRFNVKRRKQIRVDAHDRNGKPRRIKTKSKKLAMILQHEIDHLLGFTLMEKGKKL